MLLSNEFLHKNLIEKYSFYPTLILQNYQFEYYYFRDFVVQKITLELLQYIRYYHKFPSELTKSLYQEIENFVKELIAKYIVEGKVFKKNY